MYQIIALFTFLLFSPFLKCVSFLHTKIDCINLFLEPLIYRLRRRILELELRRSKKLKAKILRKLLKKQKKEEKTLEKYRKEQQVKGANQQVNMIYYIFL
jgi:hypothetical protein